MKLDTMVQPPRTPKASNDALKTFGTFDPSTMTPAAQAAAGASRRDFLKTAGVMLVGFTMAAKAPKLSAQSTTTSPIVDPTQVDSWVAISADETITCYTGKVELGQGIRTVQYQLIAEELSVSMNRINLIMGITGITPDQGSTSGSQSTLT